LPAGRERDARGAAAQGRYGGDDSGGDGSDEDLFHGDVRSSVQMPYRRSALGGAFGIWRPS
jgi:hypothetical protein